MMKRRTAGLAAACALLAGCGAATVHQAPSPSPSPSASARLERCAAAVYVMQAGGYWGRQGLNGAGSAADADPRDCSGFGNGTVAAEMNRLYPSNCGQTGTCPAGKG